MLAHPFAVLYAPYLVIAIALTIWLARTLSRNGAVFLDAVFDDPDLARAVNRLLVIGFYLVNLGWALLLLQSGAHEVSTVDGAVELLVTKLGTLLLLLGIAHLINLFIFHRVRQAARHDATA